MIIIADSFVASGFCFLFCLLDDAVPRAQTGLLLLLLFLIRSCAFFVCGLSEGVRESERDPANSQVTSTVAKSSNNFVALASQMIT